MRGSSSVAPVEADVKYFPSAGQSAWGCTPSRPPTRLPPENAWHAEHVIPTGSKMMIFPLKEESRTIRPFRSNKLRSGKRSPRLGGQNSNFGSVAGAVAIAVSTGVSRTGAAATGDFSICFTTARSMLRVVPDWLITMRAFDSAMIRPSIRSPDCSTTTSAETDATNHKTRDENTRCLMNRLYMFLGLEPLTSPVPSSDAAEDVL